jgi:dihydrofolate reductase
MYKRQYDGVMGKVMLGMTMSLDGYINDKDGSVKRLYPDLDKLRAMEVLREAVIMGRHSYDMAKGDFTDYEFQVPIFVITHFAPKQRAKGENDKLKFTYVTDGVESAIRQAKIAAGDKNVVVIGGADTTRQLLRGKLLDEIQIDIMPVLLGDGLMLFGYLNTEIQLEKTKVVEFLDRTEIRFKVIK